MSDMNGALAIAVLVLTALSSTSSLAQNPTAGSIEKSSAKKSSRKTQPPAAAVPVSRGGDMETAQESSPKSTAAPTVERSFLAAPASASKAVASEPDEPSLTTIYRV